MNGVSCSNNRQSVRSGLSISQGVPDMGNTDQYSQGQFLAEPSAKLCPVLLNTECLTCQWQPTQMGCNRQTRSMYMHAVSFGDIQGSDTAVNSLLQSSCEVL